MIQVCTGSTVETATASTTRRTATPAAIFCFMENASRLIRPTYHSSPGADGSLASCPRPCSTFPMSSGTERVERKLAAIFCADVADYSRLMHADEAGTMRTLMAHRAIMDGLIAQHGGRIANTAGDSVLAEFPSVVDAVECAVAVQEKLAEANSGLADDGALRFRIGVHVGDVMVRGGDLLGDGVNVAARVQALAEPGGLW